jgi:hypothetical protein
MRRSSWTAALSLLLLLPIAAAAMGRPAGKGRPGPVTCPPDVAAALAEQCPCAGKMMPDGSVTAWRNHGGYVSCAVRYRNALRKAGCLTMDARQTLARCAARSTCGKDMAVLCCMSETGMCNDPTPGDGTVAGTCSNDGELMCDSDADCTKTRSHVAHDEASCVAGGGTSAGSGSVCDPCPTTTTTTSTTTTTVP